MKQFLIHSFAERVPPKRKAKIAGAVLWYRTVVFKVLQSGEIPVLVFNGWDLPPFPNFPFYWFRTQSLV